MLQRKQLGSARPNEPVEDIKKKKKNIPSSNCQPLLQNTVKVFLGKLGVSGIFLVVHITVIIDLAEIDRPAALPAAQSCLLRQSGPDVRMSMILPCGITFCKLLPQADIVVAVGHSQHAV